MKLSEHPETKYEIKIKAIDAFLSAGSLNEIASSFNIHPKTLKRWITQYKEGGKANLKRKRSLNRHRRRLPTETEIKIAHLKEKTPSLTLHKAKKILVQEGIVLSIKGIWNVWKRFGLIGYDKQIGSIEFHRYITVTSDVDSEIKRAEQLLKNGDVRGTARIVNSLPTCPQYEVLEKIPDHLLNLQRRVEKLVSIYGKIPFSAFRKKAHELRKMAETKDLIYLSIRAGLWEALSLSWTDKHKELIALVHLLQERLKDNKGIFRGDPYARFLLFILEGQAWSNLYQTKKAIICSRKCRALLRSFRVPTEYKYWLAGFFTNIGYYREAGKLVKQIISEKGEDPRYITYLFSFYGIAGEFRSALRVLRRAHEKSEGIPSHIAIIQALCSLGTGNLNKTRDLVELALTVSKKGEILNQFHMATLLQAGVYAAINDRKAAMELLRKPIPILKKFNMKPNTLLRYILLRETSYLKCVVKENITSPGRLALLLFQASKSLKIRDYRKAYNYAQSQKIMGYLYLYILFFPESVHHILLKGKPAHLPSRFLKLPVFQKDIPAYHLKFLGPLRIYRNETLIRTHISPKESAFLIHLCLRKENGIPLTSLYSNFWNRSRNPERTFSHLLVRIRKYLKLSLRSLYITRASLEKEKALHFSSYITTDYQHYEETITRAKVLERAGKWGFAKREYLRAFKLFRGEPFKKMYDDWSDDKRLELIFSYETEVLSFAKKLIKRGRTEEAEKILEKAEKIIPDLNMRPQT